MNSLEQLVTHFTRFPGVGPRQARRFAMHLLTEDVSENADLARLIQNLTEEVVPCAACHRFVSYRTNDGLCSLCGDSTRDDTKILIVERDSDIPAIERSHAYDGRYFIFGGTIPLLESENAKKVRASTLKSRIEREAENLSEIILAFAANPDGDNTARYIEHLLKDILETHPHITVTHLGRGLSTGSELEYADPDTISFALSNRK